MDKDFDKLIEIDKISVRFNQFLVAVTGALVANGIKQLEGQFLGLELVPLGLAIACWAFSFYFGIN